MPMIDPVSFMLGLVVGVVLMIWIAARRGRSARSDLRGPPAQLPELTGDVRSAALKLRAEGKTIEAIRLVRERTGIGLKEAKDAVDGMR
jgi:large subunit ribosomal protein L7/L12